MTAGSRILASYGETIFTTMSALAAQHDAINLGQGFPDDEGPDDIRAIAAGDINDGYNQYPPSQGLPALRQAVAAHNQRFYGLDIEPDTGVVVTSGATEALAAAILGLVNPGDEVVVLEPYYDCYAPMIELAGGAVRPVRLTAPDWAIPEDFEAAFSDKTAAIILNSPMNPSAKVFDAVELDRIAAACVAHDVIAICDEVYEHLIFDGVSHIPLMTRTGMADRCVRIGSAGKTFSLTGWKIGYSSGPPDLMAAMQRAHQYLTFTTSPNLQVAVAYGLSKDEGYFEGLAADMQMKRDILAGGLKDAGFDVLHTQGTYFLNVGFRHLGFDETGLEFCKRITAEAGVSTIPLSPFYAPDRLGGGDLPYEADGFIRFCFSKQPAVLEQAVSRLGQFLKAGG